MQSIPKPPLIAALRRAASSDTTGPSVNVDEVVVRSIEEALSPICYLAPCGDLASQGLARIGQVESSRALTDGELFSQWVQIVKDLSLEFAREPARWRGAAKQPFFVACSNCFGIETELVPTLLMRFHEQPLENRRALFRLLGRSPAFAYLNKGISSWACEETAVSASTALRVLMQATFRSQ